jgi:hypothetical protein
MDRLIKLMAAHIGNVAEIDLAKMAWDDVDKFLHFVKTENVAFVNSSRENAKGVAAGQYNTVGGRSYDFDQSASIKMYSELLEYIKNSMYELVGITPQRLGEVSNRETVGGVERSVTQSSHITSEIFAIHDEVKKRCAEMLLETTKFALKGNKKKIQYVTNDGINAILDIDGDEFAERYYGLYVENDLDLAGLRTKLEGAAQAWSQNDTVKPSTLLSIFDDSSLESIKRKLDRDFEEKTASLQQQSQMEQQTLQQQIQAQAQAENAKMQLEQQKLQLEELLNQRDNSTKIQLKMLELQNNSEGDNTLEIEKVQVQKDKLDADIDLKLKQFYKSVELEEKKLQENVRHNKETEVISKIKKQSQNG